MADSNTPPAAGRSQSLRNIDTSFLIVAGLILLLVTFIWLSRRRLSDAAPPAGDRARASLASALRSPWAVFGAIAIFGLVVAAMMELIRRWHRNNCVQYRDEIEHLLMIARNDNA